MLSVGCIPSYHRRTQCSGVRSRSNRIKKKSKYCYRATATGNLFLKSLSHCHYIRHTICGLIEQEISLQTTAGHFAEIVWMVCALTRSVPMVYPTEGGWPRTLYVDDFHGAGARVGTSPSHRLVCARSLKTVFSRFPRQRFQSHALGVERVMKRPH